MEDRIKNIIYREIEKHEYRLDSHHILEISDIIYGQLLDHMDIKVLNKFVHDFKNEFIQIVDILIPIVEEYEGKIDQILTSHFKFKKD